MRGKIRRAILGQNFTIMILLGIFFFGGGGCKILVATESILFQFTIGVSSGVIFKTSGIGYGWVLNCGFIGICTLRPWGEIKF